MFVNHLLQQLLGPSNCCRVLPWAVEALYTCSEIESYSVRALVNSWKTWTLKLHDESKVSREICRCAQSQAQVSWCPGFVGLWE